MGFTGSGVGDITHIEDPLLASIGSTTRALVDVPKAAPHPLPTPVDRSLRAEAPQNINYQSLLAPVGPGASIAQGVVIREPVRRAGPALRKRVVAEVFRGGVHP
jgi:hypothetical protein